MTWIRPMDLIDLKLGYWDGKDWIPYGHAHGFRKKPYDPPRTGGVGYVKIAYWDDPTKAWGT